jgi:uracil-DNA glycosylase family protein
MGFLLQERSWLRVIEELQITTSLAIRIQGAERVAAWSSTLSKPATIKATSAAEFVPPRHELPILGKAVKDCRGCELYRGATQAVFGERLGDGKGSSRAAIMMIGEQPGDKEDLAGHPFVGPAGKLLAQCLSEAEIDPKQVYITNAVKHFKWEPRGKIRLHKKPSVTEIRACKPWLEAEMDAVKPKLIVCLGATAAQSLLGAQFRVSQSRGKLQQFGDLPPVIATVHPASILRARTEDDRHKQTADFIADLRYSKEFLRTI